MRLFPREAWNYAFLLILLFGIASLAVWQALTYFQTRIPHEEFLVVTAVLWSLTLGFMLIAGQRVTKVSPFTYFRG